MEAQNATAEFLFHFFIVIARVRICSSLMHTHVFRDASLASSTKAQT